MSDEDVDDPDLFALPPLPPLLPLLTFALVLVLVPVTEVELTEVSLGGMNEERKAELGLRPGFELISKGLLRNKTKGMWLR